VDVRIGVTNAPREISLELADDADREALKSAIEEALGDDSRVLWLVDKRGKQVAVPAAKIAYVEVSAPEGERRIGFGA
jgi:hypothetical protein